MSQHTDSPPEGHCPRCHSDTLRRLKTASWLERVRKSLSDKRPLICETCSWRGWRYPIAFPDHRAEPPASPNLIAIDLALDQGLESPRKVFPEGVAEESGSRVE